MTTTRRRGEAAAATGGPEQAHHAGRGGFRKRKIKRRLTRSRVAASPIDRRSRSLLGTRTPHARSLPLEPGNSCGGALAMGDWFESRGGEEEDYTARATACNMQKGPPRLELVRLFASTSGMQVGKGDWAFYGSLGRPSESLEYSYVAYCSGTHPFPHLCSCEP